MITKLMVAAVALTAMSSATFAADARKPAKMTDAQMDKVVAGAQSQNTCNGIVGCVVLDTGKIQVAVPVAAGVSALNSGATTQSGNHGRIVN